MHYGLAHINTKTLLSLLLLLAMLVLAMTDQPYAWCIKLGTVGTDMILWGWWWCWQWVGCCSVSCFMLGNQVSCAVALKLGCAMGADLTPTRPVHSLWAFHVAGWMLHAFSVALRTSSYCLCWPPQDCNLLSKEENLRDAIVSSHHVAGPMRLRCHDDRLHACDIAAAEDQ